MSECVGGIEVVFDLFRQEDSIRRELQNINSSRPLNVFTMVVPFPKIEQKGGILVN